MKAMRSLFILGAVGWCFVSGSVDVGACRSGECAQEWELCGVAALDEEGNPIECCTGFCIYPNNPQITCGSDVNQCRCVDIEATAPEGS